MQAVGSQVFIALIPIITVTCIIIYNFRLQIKQSLIRLYQFIFGNPARQVGDNPVNRGPVFGQGQCSICLEEPKKFQISATCGHTYCSSCILDIYQRTHQKVACPLCRKPITTIFKLFNDREQPAAERSALELKIRNYNARFDDNRPLIRRIAQFPYILRRMGRHLTNPVFWLLFFRSFHFIRIIGISLAYLVLPVDLIPERIFGIFGFLDDIIIFVIIALIGITIFAPIFIRNHQNA